MVYIIGKNGQPLMPTDRHGKVRRLLKSNKAIVIKRCPFTIQLMYDSTNYTQEVSLGVDAGSKHIGLSATTKDRVLFEANVRLRTDIVNNISTRRQFRKNRRSKKTRYRKARFNNRKKKEGWLAPSVKQKIDCHLTMIDKIYKILPISKIIVEVANFDIQKIKNPKVNGTDYQQGEQFNFWNVREYVLFRDGYICQCCKGKSKDKILNVHHIESRKTGGNAPNNLITLCETCHKGYHNGTVTLPKTIKRGMKFKDAAFMGIMRWAFFNKLKELYPNVNLTYGYKTKNTRIEHKLPKEHYIDARCISGNPNAISNGEVYFYKKVRCHNRQIYKAKFLKGGIRKRNQASYEVMGFRLYDKVNWNGIKCFISGRTNNRAILRNIAWEKVCNTSINLKKLILEETRRNYIVDSNIIN